jgi:polyisoprenoid-binding protein YceI
MKKIILIPAVLLVLVFSAYKAVTTSWNVKTDAVKITFELPNEGTKGTVSGLNATIDFDEKDLSKSKITATVDAKTINTGVEKRDAHLQAPDFFNTEKYPVITFTSSKIVSSDKGFIAHGALTMRDSTHNVEIPFQFENKGSEGVFKGKLSVFGGDYGVMKRSKTDKDKVDITIEVPVTK